MLLVALAALGKPLPLAPEMSVLGWRGKGLGMGVNAKRPEIWRYQGEVRALATYQNHPLAATAGGVFERVGPTWREVGIDSPPALAELSVEGGQLKGTAGDGTVFAFQAGQWRREGTRAAGTRAPSAPDAPPPGSKGAFLSATTPDGTVRSYWGDDRLWRRDGGGWKIWIVRAPGEGDYTLLPDGNGLLAGTPTGLYRHTGDAWTRESLPESLPLARPHGLAWAGDRWVIGGLQGLFIGGPGHWEPVDSAPVRQILGDGETIWVLYGNGAVDKLEPGLDRRHPDVLHGAARRPWSSCLALGAGGVLIGGNGGWIEKRGEVLIERYPKELQGQVVTAIRAEGDLRLVGTQKGGLFVFSPKGVKFYNPGTGLPDPWVTALGPDGLVATANRGLFRLSVGSMKPFAGPTKNPRHLLGGSIVGGMDGVWIRSGARWKPIVTEEATALVQVHGRVAVMTVGGVYWPN